MADSPVITCPECKKKFKGKSNLEGKKIKCPLCAKMITVPKSEAITAAPAPPPPGNDDDNDKAGYGITTLDIAPRCPNCAQLMADEKAFICLYCGYNTLTREIGKTEKLVGHTTGERVKHLIPGIIALVVAYGFICGLTWFSVELPKHVYKSSMAFLDHESVRMWFTIISLSFMWGCGLFAYKRFIVNPTPEAKKKA